MQKFSLALIFGGASDEHEVSCISAASIYLNLDTQKYEVWPLAITRSGHWYLQEPYNQESVRQAGRLMIDTSPQALVSILPGQGFLCREKLFRPSLVFPIVHGINGEDGCLQGLLESINLPYCGANVIASAIGMDKEVAKRLWEAAGLPVVPYKVINLACYRLEPRLAREVFDKALCEWGLPFFIKPANSGSSVGVAKVTSWDEFLSALERAFLVDTKVLIEQAINAREIEVAVIGTDSPSAYGPGEVLSNHDFYDYTAKYIDPQGALLEVPAKLHQWTSTLLLKMALKAFQVIGGRNFARVDFFIDRKIGQIFINEINTLPGFTTISMFPRMCMASGLSYSQVLDFIIQDALTTACNKISASKM